MTEPMSDAVLVAVRRHAVAVRDDDRVTLCDRAMAGDVAARETLDPARVKPDLHGTYTVERAPDLGPDTWIVVVTTDEDRVGRLVAVCNSVVGAMARAVALEAR